MSADLFAARLDAILGGDEGTEALGLPAGTWVASYDDGGFVLAWPGWATHWLAPGSTTIEDARRSVEWPADWSHDTITAGERPDASDADLARLLAEDVAAAAVEAVAHEFYEQAQLRGVPLWADAHPGAAATMTPRLLFRVASRAVPAEVDIPHD